MPTTAQFVSVTFPDGEVLEIPLAEVVATTVGDVRDCTVRLLNGWFVADRFAGLWFDLDNNLLVTVGGVSVR